MSWRAESTFVPSSKLSDDEKEFLKNAKKVREVLKLEERARAGEQLESKQVEKVAGKEGLLKEIASLAVKLPANTEVLEKNQDVTDLLPASIQDKILGLRKKEATRLARKQEADQKEKETIPFMSRHDRPITGIAVSNDGKYIFTCSKDKYVICWSTAASLLKSICTLGGHTGAVWGVDVSPPCSGSPSRLLTGGADGKVMLWGVDPICRARGDTRSNPDKCLDHGGVIRVLRWCPFDTNGDSQRFASACEKLAKKPTSITVWCVSGTKVEQVLEITTLPTKANDIQWGGGSKTKIFSAHDNGYVGVWGPEDGTLMKKLQLHTGPVASLCLTCDSSTLLTASHDSTASAVDVSKPSCDVVATYKTNRPLNAVAVSPDYKPNAAGFVTIAGGRDPREVTTSKLLEDEFESFILKSEGAEVVANGKGHFGPVHETICLSKVARAKGAAAFATISEDGCLRVHGVDGTLLYADVAGGDIKA
eukprot:gnl/TRDRNA2_/TRDRNA2_178435_c0_seq1.p1 gnl/TRDRNA2_/TRDRNA2_178435_c0~~gnl/TRDRNA2_/TRDRNA2_178435_c0_seq1.p1  ORF type:complete len:478 (-),score=99.56 gnl/TRDRNA2_/TRDRNA2_178435_c0_seq1:38-1471(-)